MGSLQDLSVELIYHQNFHWSMNEVRLQSLADDATELAEVCLEKGNHRGIGLETQVSIPIVRQHVNLSILAGRLLTDFTASGSIYLWFGDSRWVLALFPMLLNRSPRPDASRFMVESSLGNDARSAGSVRPDVSIRKSDSCFICRFSSVCCGCLVVKLCTFGAL